MQTENTAETPSRTRYVVQAFDTDGCYWETVDEIPPCGSRSEAESEARHWKRRLCGNIRTRVVTF